MSTTFSVQMEQVDYIVGEMVAGARQMQKTLVDLDNEVRKYLAEWSSDTKTAYEEAKAKWDAAAADMALKAERAATMLGTINEYYCDGERNGVNLWKH
jgi:uncharacterized protein YukE